MLISRHYWLNFHTNPHHFLVAVHRPIDDWKTWAVENGWTEYAIKNYIQMCSHYNDHGYKFGNDITLQAILGRPATDYRTFVKKFIKLQEA